MNVALIGYGKMGREIEKALLRRGHRVAVIIDADNRDELNAANLQGVDAAVEFTTPQSALENVTRCLDLGLPVVCGTTGWQQSLPQAEARCRETGGAFFYASNFSIGVNILFRANRWLARVMNCFPAYDPTIEEVHHIQKKDAPSGTAVTLAEGVLDHLGRKHSWTCGLPGSSEELQVAALRRSTAPGTHTITYESPDDILRLEHVAKGRTGFAEGVVLAVEFIIGKQGVYTMNDMLNF